MITNNFTQEIILYGAGERSRTVYMHLKDKYNIVCVCDKNSAKHNTVLTMPDNKDLVVFSLEDAINSYSNSYLYITADVPLKYEICDYLLNEKKINICKILNFEPYSLRTSCTPIETTLVFGNNNIQACCVTEDSPVLNYNNDISDTQLHSLINDFKSNISMSLESKPLTQCKNCMKIHRSFWADSPKIKEVNLIAGSMCQFKCIYCNNDENMSDARQENLKRVLEYINFLIEEREIDFNTHFSIANGEITINPLREKVFKTIRGFCCTFYTNAEIYSDDIAEFLKSGNSKVNVSLDSGTKSTFMAVKGKDCFERVTRTIQKYAECYEKCIELKYIIIPSVNDNEEDVVGFVNIAAKCRADIIISRDSNRTDDFDLNITSCLHTAELIITLAKQNNLSVKSILNSFKSESKYEKEIADLILL